MDIAGHAALVTGGAPASAPARELARQGARVAVLDRNAAGRRRSPRDRRAGRVGRLRHLATPPARSLRWLDVRPRTARRACDDEHGRHRQRQAHRRQGRLARAAGRLPSAWCGSTRSAPHNITRPRWPRWSRLSRWKMASAAWSSTPPRWRPRRPGRPGGVFASAKGGIVGMIAAGARSAQFGVRWAPSRRACSSRR